MKTDMYFMKIMTTASPYFQIVRGHWRYKDAVMLKPEELKLAQGFPPDYIIDHDAEGNPYPIKEQVAKIGNSVVPIMAMKIAQANLEAE